VPKKVDHEQRRNEIADAAGRLAAANGLAGVSFREVAAEAGMSVANVQHYFGSKHDLLVGALDRQFTAIGGRILSRLDALGPSAAPLEQVRAIATSFVPTDDTSAAAMRVYLGFAGVAFTDPALRSTEAFANGRNLIATLADRFRAAAAAGDLRSGVDAEREATSLVALLLGLSLCVLLDQMSAEEAMAALDHHLLALGPTTVADDANPSPRD
jgi:TetR/AcrR family transcriptional regulator, transcriptional repressor of bet genes